jgi:hypothetical protein
MTLKENDCQFSVQFSLGTWPYKLYVLMWQINHTFFSRILWFAKTASIRAGDCSINRMHEINVKSSNWVVCIRQCVWLSPLTTSAFIQQPCDKTIHVTIPCIDKAYCDHTFGFKNVNNLYVVLFICKIDTLLLFWK